MAVAIIQLNLLTECRSGQGIEKLCWGEVDLEGKYIKLPPERVKTRRWRTIYLGTPALNILQNIRDSLENPPAPTDFVFPSSRTNSNYASTDGVWEKVRKKAGLEKANARCRLYDLRHTFSTTANRLGYTLETTGHLLGHSSNRTITARYIHVNDDVDYSFKAVEQVSTLLYKWLSGAEAKKPRIYNNMHELTFDEDEEEE